jgi:hypothetical protein
MCSTPGSQRVPKGPSKELISPWARDGRRPGHQLNDRFNKPLITIGLATGVAIAATCSRIVNSARRRRGGCQRF